MFTVRRWWNQHGAQVIFIGVLLGTAWIIRQTQAAPVYELYYWITRPLQTDPSPEEQLTNARILELQQRLVELEQQNQQLKELLKYAESQEQSAIAPGGVQSAIVAPIIGRSADQWWQQITLGIGSRKGVKAGFIVTGYGGLVGRVTSVTPNTCRVLLISDPDSRVGVTISRSRYMGFMRGQGNQQAVMQFFEKTPDVRPGDVVITSSVSRLFPPGIPIGRVQSINLAKSPAPEAVIELTAPFGYLEWAFVHPFNSPQIQIYQ